MIIDKRGQSNHKEVILKKLVESYPRYETHADLFQRAKVIKSFLLEYLRSNPLNIEKQEKYCIVSHSRIIAAMTA